jgi:multidrug efflux system outer membrane protein
VRQRIPEGLFGGAGGAFNAEQYSVNVGVSGYELDVFGRIRSLKDAALQSYLATDQVRRAVQIGLVAEVAQAFLSYAADSERLLLAQDTLKLQQTALELTRQRFEAGVTAALAVRQAETTVESARADVARFTSLVSQDRNALDLVVGSPVADTNLPQGALDAAATMLDVPAGLPSELLQRRPDILSAEHRLLAAYANIGAARANFFPTISLTGSAGTASGALSSLFTVGTGAWSFAPQLAMPIFNAGRNKANLQVAQVDRELAVANYERSIQSAFREVADALATRATIDEQIAAQQALTTAASEGLRLADARFKGGVDSFLPVLDAQRQLYQAQQGLIAVRLARAATLLGMYRALGGGWTEPPPQQATATP